MQAYQVWQALLEEIKGLEADYFSQLLAYLERLKEVDSDNQFCFKCNESIGAFEAACVALAAIIFASERLRRFYAIDACHTKSRFPMMLMIVVSIDTND